MLRVTFLLFSLVIASCASCFCDDLMKVQEPIEVIEFDTYPELYVSFHCCAKQVLQNISHIYNPETDVVTWKHKGIPYPWDFDEDNFDVECFPQTLIIKNPQFSDGGVYTCSYDINGYGTIHQTFKLTLHEHPNSKPAPPIIMSNSSRTTLARHNERVVLFCSAFVGSFDGSIMWYKKCGDNNSMCRINGTEENGFKLLCNDTLCTGTTNDDMSGLKNLKIIYQHLEGNKILSTLIMESVNHRNFGDYICLASKSSMSSEVLSSRRSFTILEGVSELTARKETYLGLAISITVGAIVFTIVLICTYNARLAIILMCRQFVPDRRSGNFVQDLFIIHGESASPWVWGKLVATLEGKFGYSCFLPSRDLIGGDGLVDLLAQEIHSSRRVLVIITPCLLQCPWSLWCLEQAVTAVLKKELKIIAVIRQDIKDSAISKDFSRLITLLSYMTTIKYPSKSYSADSKDLTQTTNFPQIHKCKKTTKEQPVKRSYLDAASTQEFTRPKSELCFSESRINEIKSEIKSNSLHIQRIQNMISSSHDLSKPLQCADEEHKLNGDIEKASEVSVGDLINAQQNMTKTVVVSNDEVVPDTPCSVTPFFPSSIKGDPRRKNREDYHTNSGLFQINLSLRLKKVFFKDKENEFWQKLLRELPVTPINKMVGGGASSNV